MMHVPYGIMASDYYRVPQSILIAMTIDPSKLLAYRVLALSQLLYRGIERVLDKELDLSVRQWRVLLMLASRGPQTSQAIAQFWRYDKSQVSRAVAELGQKGLVHTAACAQDRRRLIVRLTPAGHALHARGLPLSLERQAQLTSRLSPNDVQQFEQTLDSLLNQAEALLQDPPEPS